MTARRTIGAMPKSKPFRFDEEEPPKRRGRKAELGSPAEAAAAPTARVIAKVRTPNYVPPGFVVRTRIDATMFTADAPPDAVDAANDDPEVESISHARNLRP